MCYKSSAKKPAILVMLWLLINSLSTMNCVPVLTGSEHNNTTGVMSVPVAVSTLVPAPIRKYTIEIITTTKVPKQRRTKSEHLDTPSVAGTVSIWMVWSHLFAFHIS